MIAKRTVYQNVAAGDNNFVVPAEVTTLVGVQIARQAGTFAGLLNIRKSAEQPVGNVINDQYIFVLEIISSVGLWWEKVNVEVEGGTTLVLNSSIPLYVILFFA